MTGSATTASSRSATWRAASATGQADGEDRELVSAQARDRVALAQGGEQPLPDVLQQQVADVVPEGLVHVLEVVQVDQHDRRARARAAAEDERLLDLAVQPRAVGQSGQVVQQRPAGPLGREHRAVVDGQHRQQEQHEHERREGRGRDDRGTGRQQHPLRAELHARLAAQVGQRRQVQGHRHDDGGQPAVDHEEHHAGPEAGPDVAQHHRVVVGQVAAPREQAEGRPGGRGGQHQLGGVEDDLARLLAPAHVVDQRRQHLDRQEQPDRPDHGERQREGRRDADLAARRADRDGPRLAEQDQDREPDGEGRRAGQPDLREQQEQVDDDTGGQQGEHADAAVQLPRDPHRAARRRGRPGAGACPTVGARADGLSTRPGRPGHRSRCCPPVVPSGHDRAGHPPRRRPRAGPRERRAAVLALRQEGLDHAQRGRGHAVGGAVREEVDPEPRPEEVPGVPGLPGDDGHAQVHGVGAPHRKWSRGPGPAPRSHPAAPAIARAT